MKSIKNADLLISIGISFIGIVITCYLWTFLNGGNHWDLFGTPFERFLMQYGDDFLFLFSGILVLPIFFKRDKKRIITALSSIPIYLFLARSLVQFLD